MQHQGDENLLWESKIESVSGTNMDPSAGTGGSVQVSPSMFTLDRRFCNGDFIQTFFQIGGMHDLYPQILHIL